MKVSYDDRVYAIRDAKEDEKRPTDQVVSQQDIDIMLEALRLLFADLPNLRRHVKLFKFGFAQQGSFSGQPPGKLVVIPYMVLKHPDHPGGGEVPVSGFDRGFIEGQCLFLPLTDASKIADWLKHELKEAMEGNVIVADRVLRSWKAFARQVVGAEVPVD